MQQQKNYVDNSSYTSSKAGLIPNLYGDTGNRSGHITSASSEYSLGFAAYMVFNTQLNNTGGSNEWASTTTTNCWFQIQFPIAIKI